MSSILENSRWIPWTMTFFILGFIFYVSHLTFAVSAPGPVNLSAATYHISVFFALALFMLAAALWRGGSKKIFLICIAASLVYAALDELHQSFVPGRFMSFSDIIFDATGIALASLIYLFILSRQS